jgi:hypothetical protein
MTPFQFLHTRQANSSTMRNTLHPTGVVGLSRDSASGALSLLSGSPFAAGLAPGYITGDAFGRFVYVANSGDTSGTAGISGFTVNATTGELVAMPGSPFAATQKPHRLRGRRNCQVRLRGQ